MSERVGHISASSIAAFKACPTRYRIGYVEAVRVEQEAQPLRMGTAWHKGLEILEAPEGTLYVFSDPATCLIICETHRLEYAVDAATAVYTQVPEWADPVEWAIEREVVANALAAYAWLYPGGMSEYETVATELQFDLPLVNPETGHSTPSFRRVGKIDRIIRHKGTGRLMIQENKTTSKSIDSGSTYWDRLRKDTQSKFYIQAARDLQMGTQVTKAREATIFPLMPADKKWVDTAGSSPVISGLLHDVFHKPQISPKMLTQADSKAFVQTGDYCGQHFEVAVVEEQGTPILASVKVDGIVPEIEPGKKEGTFALRETPAMFGARLFADMTGQTDLYKEAHGPAYYFARREIAFTDAELLDFQYQVWSLQKTMNEMERTGHWYENEQQCEATFKCPYCVLCYQNVDVYHGQTPPGFKRLRVEEAEQTEAATE